MTGPDEGLSVGPGRQGGAAVSRWRPIPNGPAPLPVDTDALEENPYGFESADSVPYLHLRLTIVLPASGGRREGLLDPMVSRDGFQGRTSLVPGERLPPDHRGRAAAGACAPRRSPDRGLAFRPPFTVTGPFYYP